MRSDPGEARADATGEVTPEHNGHKRPVVKRTVFATPRAAEFLELRALQGQTGQPDDAFGHVVVKELVDNALDAAESVGVAPVVEISAPAPLTGSLSSP